MHIFEYHTTNEKLKNFQIRIDSKSPDRIFPKLPIQRSSPKTKRSANKPRSSFLQIIQLIPTDTSREDSNSSSTPSRNNSGVSRVFRISKTHNSNHPEGKGTRSADTKPEPPLRPLSAHFPPTNPFLPEQAVLFPLGLSPRRSLNKLCVNLNLIIIN